MMNKYCWHLNSNELIWRHILYNFCFKSYWSQQIFEFSIEIERAYQELSKNEVFDNFH